MKRKRSQYAYTWSSLPNSKAEKRAHAYSPTYNKPCSFFLVEKTLSRPTSKMVRFAFFVPLAVALVTSCSPLRPRSAAQIETDLNNLITNVTSLNTAIENLSTGFAAVGPVESDTATLLTNLQTAISHAEGTGPLDTTDGQNILTLTQKLASLITTTLANLDAAEPELVADNKILPGILTLIKDDLNQLSGNTTILENSLVSIAPTQLQPAASTVIASVNAAFATAIAVYATAAWVCLSV